MVQMLPRSEHSSHVRTTTSGAKRAWRRQVATLISVAGLAAIAPATASAAGACPTLPPPPSSTPISTAHVFGPTQLGQALMTPDGPATFADGLLQGFAGSRLRLAVPDSSSAGYSAAADRDGNLYYVDRLFTVVKVTPTGQEVWRRTTEMPLKSVFVIGTGADQRIGAAMRDAPASRLWKLDGTSAGDSTIAGDRFNPTPSGGLIAVDGGKYVRVYDATGERTLSVGYKAADNASSPNGAPQQFYQLGGAAQLPDGKMLVTDTLRGIIVLDADGVQLGALPAADVDPAGLTQSSTILVRGDDVYVQSGQRFSWSQYVSKLSLAAVLERATHGETSDQRLGLGAGLTVNGRSGYVRTGRADVRAVFDAWWAASARDLQLCYSVYDEAGMRGDTTAISTTTVPVAPLVGQDDGVSLELPNDLPAGPYEVEASLIRGGRAVATTSVPFTVAAPAQKLDFAALPSGEDAGGPLPSRSVAYADVLGTGLARIQLDWTRLMPDGPTGPLDFSVYDQQIADAADEAERRGITLEVQVGQGGPERALVDAGTWEARVREVVARYKDDVHAWEAWNEPNLTYGPAADYVTKVLAPFHRAVKAVDRTATVVGGSVCGIGYDYWRQIVAAGGLDVMDVAGIHPYPGHNRSFEEQGTIAELPVLRELLKRDGRQIPVWMTELAWWSDGSHNLMAQADTSARALLWMRANGIDKWAYFIPEGSWGNDGVTFSTVQTGGFVKPSALALMTTSGQIAGRPFLGMVDTGAPSTYAMRFGPRAGSTGGELLVAWTDELRLPAVIAPDASGRTIVQTSGLGAARTRTLRGEAGVMLDTSPTFFALDGPGRLSIAPGETFGDNLALAANGATASATSEWSTNTASAAIDGDAGFRGGGDVNGLPIWMSVYTDQTPTLTVRLARAAELDRVLVAAHSNGSVIVTPRDYDVQVQSAADGSWSTVARVRRQYMRRQALVAFARQRVTAVRVIVRDVNYTGYVGGAKPIWWRDAYYGGVGISEVRAYAPGAKSSAAAEVPAPPSDELPAPVIETPVVEPPAVEPPAIEPPVVTPPVVTPPVATPTPVVTPPVVTPPVATPTPVVTPPVVTPPVATPTPVVTPPVVTPPVATPTPGSTTAPVKAPAGCVVVTASNAYKLKQQLKTMKWQAQRAYKAAWKLPESRRAAALAKARELDAKAKKFEACLSVSATAARKAKK
jgi:hypothetical protein